MKIKKTFDGMEIIRNKHIKCVSIITFIVTLIVKRLESHQRKGAVVIGFTTTCAIGVYHHLSCEFQPRSWRVALDTRFWSAPVYRLAYPYELGVRLTIFWVILRPYDSANLRYFRKVFGSGPWFHCGSVYYRLYRHFRLLKKRCQNVKILIINPKSI
jgi:hypothetical protein